MATIEDLQTLIKLEHSMEYLIKQSVSESKFLNLFLKRVPKRYRKDLSKTFKECTVIDIFSNYHYACAIHDFYISESRKGGVYERKRPYRGIFGALPQYVLDATSQVTSNNRGNSLLYTRLMMAFVSSRLCNSNLKLNRTGRPYLNTYIDKYIEDYLNDSKEVNSFVFSLVKESRGSNISTESFEKLMFSIEKVVPINIQLSKSLNVSFS
jgi:hypothetical protein